MRATKVRLRTDSIIPASNRSKPDAISKDGIASNLNPGRIVVGILAEGSVLVRKRRLFRLKPASPNALHNLDVCRLTNGRARKLVIVAIEIDPRNGVWFVWCDNSELYFRQRIAGFRVIGEFRFAANRPTFAKLPGHSTGPAPNNPRHRSTGYRSNGTFVR